MSTSNSQDSYADSLRLLREKQTMLNADIVTTNRQLKEAKSARDHLIAALKARRVKDDYNFKVGSPIQRSLVLTGSIRLAVNASAHQRRVEHLTAVLNGLEQELGGVNQQLRELERENALADARAQIAGLGNEINAVADEEIQRLLALSDSELSAAYRDEVERSLQALGHNPASSAEHPAAHHEVACA